MKNGSVFYTDNEIGHTFKTEEVSFFIEQILWSRLDSSSADFFKVEEQIETSCLFEIIRLDLTKNYISAINDSTTIRIFEYNPDEVLNIGNRPRVEVRYVLAEDAEE